MLKLLTPAQVAQYHERGFVSPIRVMSADAALEYRRRLEAFEASTGGTLGGDLRHKSHLLFTWLAELVRHDRILDAVEDLYGPDLLCWSTNFFIKEKSDPAFVSWHQDSTYWGLSRPDVVSAWVAFTPAHAGNGAMQVIPGSHLFDQIPHRDTFDKHNLLTRSVRLRERTARRWCAAATAITISSSNRGLHAISIRSSWPCTSRSPSAMRRSSIAARTSRATTIRARSA